MNIKTTNNNKYHVNELLKVRKTLISVTAIEGVDLSDHDNELYDEIMDNLTDSQDAIYKMTMIELPVLKDNVTRDSVKKAIEEVLEWENKLDSARKDIESTNYETWEERELAYKGLHLLLSHKSKAWETLTEELNLEVIYDIFDEYK
ncbi:hypothetical protein AAIE21_09605 [Paenibacillus sp. 102]|uniref:hypothetical protein n=1 Tax=Paenibacillus sp. 102 TaxID=3120823 RepID=UPI0031B9DE10